MEIMQIQTLKESIQRKDDQIQLLKLILQAIHQLKEKKSLRSDAEELKNLENELFKL